MKLRRSHLEREQRPMTAEVASAQGQEFEEKFDPSTDLLFSDWESAKRSLERYDHFNDLNVWNYISVIAVLVNLFPERRKELQIDQAVFEKVKGRIDRPDNYFNYLNMVLFLSMLFPERREEMTADEQKIKFSIQEFKSTRAQDSRFAVRMAYNFVLLFPERRDELGLSEDDFQRWKGDVDELRESKYADSIETASWLCRLFPEHKPDLGIDNTEIRRLKQELEICRANEQWDELFRFAMCLATVSADDVRMSDQGLEFIQKTSLGQPPTLPPRNLAS